MSRVVLLPWAGADGGPRPRQQGQDKKRARVTPVPRLPRLSPPPGPEAGGAPRPAGVPAGHPCLPMLGALERLATGPEVLSRGLRAQGPPMLLHAVPHLTPAPGWSLEPPAELPGFAPASPYSPPAPT